MSCGWGREGGRKRGGFYCESKVLQGRYFQVNLWPENRGFRVGTCSSEAELVLGTTLNCLFDDSSTTTTPSRHDRHKKTDLYESIDSMRTQPPRWLAVCVRTHAVMQDSHFNLVSCTPTDLTTGPTTKGAHYLENGIGTRRQMGIRGGHYGFIDPLTSRWQT